MSGSNSLVGKFCQL